ncbi:MAG: hypothetical protein ACR2LC_09485 [Pyrinomonadaceae bacterium]
MIHNPRRTARQSNPFSLINSQRGLAVNQTPDTELRNGYTISITRSPSWRAQTNTGAPFFVVDSFGASRDDAITKLLTRIDELKARIAA